MDIIWTAINVCNTYVSITISLIPVSFPAGSLGLEEGRGGGTKVPGARGVVGRFGTGTKHRNTYLFWSVLLKLHENWVWKTSLYCVKFIQLDTANSCSMTSFFFKHTSAKKIKIKYQKQQKTSKRHSKINGTKINPKTNKQTESWVTQNNTKKQKTFANNM